MGAIQGENHAMLSQDNMSPLAILSAKGYTRTDAHHLQPPATRMFKFIVLALVLIWIMGLFLGRKRRLIKSTSQLVRLILWACFGFFGATALPRMDMYQGHNVFLAVSLVLWIAASWWVAGALTRSMDKKKS